MIVFNTERFQQFFHAVLNEHIYLVPSTFESGFIIASAHTEEEINQTLKAIEETFSNYSLQLKTNVDHLPNHSLMKN